METGLLSVWLSITTTLLLLAVASGWPLFPGYREQGWERSPDDVFVHRREFRVSGSRLRYAYLRVVDSPVVLPVVFPDFLLNCDFVAAGDFPCVTMYGVTEVRATGTAVSLVETSQLGTTH
jgi:hypothetical protein